MLLLLVFMSMIASSVRAQTTTIANLQYPKKTLFGQSLATNGVTVSFTIGYSGVDQNLYLWASVLTRPTNAYDTVHGIVTDSSPLPCHQYQPELALCWLQPSSSSGIENATFQVPLNTTGTYQLYAFAAVSDRQGSIISGSSTYSDFSIDVTSSLQLTVSVPSPVAVAIDGQQQAPGGVSITVRPGTHSIIVPNLVQLDNNTRLRFDHWSDGMTQTARSENLQQDATFQAVYVRQFRLVLTSPQGTADGAGWFDEGATASYSITQSESMSGVLGVLGASWTFSGWYENGGMVSSSPHGSIAMNQSHSLAAQWSGNYVGPFLILALVGGISVAGLAYRRRRTRVPSDYRVGQDRYQPALLVCAKCGYQNAPSFVKCARCHAPLDVTHVY